MSIHQVSVKRACQLLNTSRSAYQYQATLPDDQEVRKTLQALSEKHRRYGFKKLFQKTRQQGHRWNHKRVYRIYCEMKLNLRCKRKKRLPSRDKVALVVPRRMNVSWSMDFMSDALMNGRRFRTVNLMDDCNREALGIQARFSLPAQRVVEFLEGVASQRGYPLQLRLDNGPENISQAILMWAKKNGVHIHYIQPGKPAQNAYIERFNRTYREEVLSMYLFRSIAEVESMTHQWLQEYNGERPHESLGNFTPIGFRKKLISTEALY